MSKKSFFFPFFLFFHFWWARESKPAREHVRQAWFINISLDPCAWQLTLLVCQPASSRITDEVAGMCVCVRACVSMHVWLSLVCQPTFQNGKSLLGKKRWSACRFGWGPGTVDSSEVAEAPCPLSNAAAGGCVRLPAPAPHQALLTLITSSLAEFTGGFPWRRRLPLPKPPAAHFLSGLAGPWWNRSLCLLHSLHNLVLEVDLSPLEIRRIKAAFKSRSGY